MADDRSAGVDHLAADLDPRSLIGLDVRLVRSPRQRADVFGFHEDVAAKTASIGCDSAEGLARLPSREVRAVGADDEASVPENVPTRRTLGLLAVLGLLVCAAFLDPLHQAGEDLDVDGKTLVARDGERAEGRRYRVAEAYLRRQRIEDLAVQADPDALVDSHAVARPKLFSQPIERLDVREGSRHPGLQMFYADRRSACRVVGVFEDVEFDEPVVAVVLGSFVHPLFERRDRPGRWDVGVEDCTLKRLAILKRVRFMPTPKRPIVPPACVSGAAAGRPSAKTYSSAALTEMPSQLSRTSNRSGVATTSIHSCSSSADGFCDRSAEDARRSAFALSNGIVDEIQDRGDQAHVAREHVDEHPLRWTREYRLRVDDPFVHARSSASREDVTSRQ